jgi:hypothetical protein
MDCDVLVAGGGSGGFGAALAAARGGLSVLLVEAHGSLGGTSTVAGVSAWESGCGGTGAPFELYRRLQREPGAVAIYGVGRHCCWPDEGAYPGGENVLRPELRYADTLVRYGLGPLSYLRREDRPLIRRRFNGVVFEPGAMARLMAEMLAETGRVHLALRTRVVEATVSAGYMVRVGLSDGSAVAPRFVVDATGDGTLCALGGAEQFSGEDPRERFGEPGAPERPSGRVNGVTLIFRVGRKDQPGLDPLPASVPTTCWWRQQFPAAHVVPFPNGDLSVNLLPTMEGAEFLERGYDDALAECRRRVVACWHHGQSTFPEWQVYRMVGMAAALGVRETRRTRCLETLRQQDLEAGLGGQRHPDIVAIADHNVDVHGPLAGSVRPVGAPYGIPYRCLLPCGLRNVLVACRGAGFSSLAASACRLSRTILQLGQAAGTACALASRDGQELPELAPDTLRAELKRQQVTLAWPTETHIAAAIRAE